MTDEQSLLEYRSWINDLKSKIQSARVKAAMSVNSQLIELYWEIGKELAEKSKIASWGTGIIDKIATDLKHSFPDIKGFSRRNLYAIKQFYEFYQAHFEFVPQPVAQIPWGHNRLILSRCTNLEQALFYAEQAFKEGWSREVLDRQTLNNLFESKANSTHNFENTLPTKQSELAVQTLKDPYNFDFLGILDEAKEREIENELVSKITDFLLELGKGFAFVGKQYTY